MSAVVAVVSTLVALGSHVLAGGPLPAAQGVLVPLLLAVVVCLPLSGRLHSLPRLVPAVVLSQLLYHWLFVLGAPGTASLVAVEGAEAHAGHAGHAFVLLGSAAAESADALMWAAHGLAAVLTIALIRRGEAALLGLQCLLVLVARAILPALPVHASLEAAAPRAHAAPIATPLTGLGRLAETVTRRGPPRPLVHAAP